MCDDLYPLAKYTFPASIRETCKYCAPLFAINSLAINGFSDLADFPGAASENGTVTFICFEGDTYAVTAYHVIEYLREIAKGYDSYLFTTLHGIRGGTKIDLYVPSFPDDFCQPEAFHAKPPDVALCRISPHCLAEIGKAAFPFDSDANNNAQVAIAVGYPTEEKLDLVDDQNG